MFREPSSPFGRLVAALAHPVAIAGAYLLKHGRLRRGVQRL